MKFNILLFIGLSYCGLIYGQKIEQVKTKIDSIFNKQLAQDNVHNAFLTIQSDKLGVTWNYSDGTFKDGTPVTEQNPFHSTSVAKTFTATLIMMLQEEGKLDVNDPISEYLSGEIITGLHVYNGKDYSKQILIKQLLQHTSGLPDYFEDTPKNGPSFMEQLFINSDRMWQPIETINFAKLQLEPHFPPGTSYKYSDTEYVLLGLLIEELTSKAYHHVLAEKIFNPLEMEHSYMHLRSKPHNKKTGKLSEFYVEDTDVSEFNSLSADWAGGGLATTSKDLAKFHRALNNGKIITKRSFKEMQKWTKESFGLEYGYGLRKFQLKKMSPVLRRYTLIGHSGTSGAFMYYCPEMDVYLTGTFNQTSYQKKHVVFMIQVLTQLNKLSKIKKQRE